MSRPTSGIRLKPLVTATNEPLTTISSIKRSLTSPTHTQSSSIDLQDDRPVEPDIWSGFNSTCAPAASLDDYVAYQNQQSHGGLEVVYGLKVELSRFYEELIDRNERWGAPLPYRVMGTGGVLYWKARREEHLKRLGGTEEEKAIEAALASVGVDPFGTSLTSYGQPPPISPEAILPAYVTLNMLKVATRTAFNDYEDQLDDMRQTIQAQQTVDAKLRAELAKLKQSLEMKTSTSSTDSAATDASASSPQRRHTVHYSDQQRLLSDILAEASPNGSIDLNSPAIGSIPELSSRSQSKSPTHTRRKSRASMVGEMSRSREQLERKVIQLEAALAKERETTTQLRSELAEFTRTHNLEVVDLTAQLAAKKSELHERGRELTKKVVQLNLESIARRQRAEQRLKVEAFFTKELQDAEKELKRLFDPKRELLFVKRADPTPLIAFNPAAATGTTERVMDRSPSARVSRARSAKKKTARPPFVPTSPSPLPSPSMITPASPAPLPLLPLPSPSSSAPAEESKENLSTALVPVEPSVESEPDSELYPSAASPLAALEQSMATPKGKQWLGKLLSPAPVRTPSPAPVITSNERVSPSRVSPDKSTISGHLLPGADLLSTDLLLVLDSLFHLEYQNFARSSAELSSTIEFLRETKPTKPDHAPTAEEMKAQPFGPLTGATPTPSTSDISSLVAAISPTSLTYLQTIQRIFQTLYHRLPVSLQQRYSDLSEKMKRVQGLNQKYLQQQATELHAKKEDQRIVLQPNTAVVAEEKESETVEGVKVSVAPLVESSSTPLILTPPPELAESFTDVSLRTFTPGPTDSTELTTPLPSAVGASDSPPVSSPSRSHPNPVDSFSNTQTSSTVVSQAAPHPNVSLGRLEVILHKIQAVANCRGVDIQ